MYAYEFQNKGDVTLFQCLNEPLIMIDKEDMVHTLSAAGNWMVRNGKVRLAFNPDNVQMLLSQYLLNADGHKIRHINNNPLDFRKSNLLICKHAHSPYFIRPLSIQDVPLFPKLSDADTLRFFHIIRRHHQPIGYFAVLPIRTSFYHSFLKENKPKETALRLSAPYENDTNYFHLLYGYFPKDIKLFSYIRHYYKQLRGHLHLRNIHIEEALTFQGNLFREVMGESDPTLQNNNPHITHLPIFDW